MQVTLYMYSLVTSNFLPKIQSLKHFSKIAYILVKIPGNFEKCHLSAHYWEPLFSKNMQLKLSVRGVQVELFNNAT